MSDIRPLKRPRDDNSCSDNNDDDDSSASSSSLPLQEGIDEPSAAIDRVHALRSVVGTETIRGGGDGDGDLIVESERTVLDKRTLLAESISGGPQEDTRASSGSLVHSTSSSSLAPIADLSPLARAASLDKNDESGQSGQGGLTAPNSGGPHLPQNIVMSIVQFLPISSLASCILVNKTFARACFTRGAIRQTLDFSYWPNATYLNFLRCMFHDNPRKLDLIDTVCGSSRSLFLAFQIMGPGQLQNANITSLRWDCTAEYSVGESQVEHLQSIYPNLTSIHLNMDLSIAAILDHFPHLRSLSIQTIRDADILDRGDLCPVPSLQELNLSENGSSMTLHYVCHMFPNLTGLAIRSALTYDNQTMLTISETPLVRRYLDGLPVPPLRSLVLDGEALTNDDIFHDFIFRLDRLETIELRNHSLGCAEDLRRMQTIINNNYESITGIETDCMIGLHGFQLPCASKNQLQRLEFGASVPDDLHLIEHFKSLKHLHMRSLEDIEFQDHHGRSIEALVNLVSLTVPSHIDIAFERLPKLRSLKLTGHAPSINVRSSSLEDLDMIHSKVNIATITCPNLESFVPSLYCRSLQLTAPKLEHIDVNNDTIHLCIQSQSLSCLNMFGCGDIQSCNLATPSLTILDIPWSSLQRAKWNHHDIMQQLPSCMHLIRDLTITGSGPIILDESFYRFISSFSNLTALCFFECEFASSLQSTSEITPIPSVTCLNIVYPQGFCSFAEIMARLFPNVQTFSLGERGWQRLPEDHIVECIVESWGGLTDLSIEFPHDDDDDDDYNDPPHLFLFTTGAIQTIFDAILERNVIRKLSIILPLEDNEGNRYCVYLRRCTSLRELKTNVITLASPSNGDGDGILPRMHTIRIANFCGMNRMTGEQACHAMAQWLSMVCPNVEMLDLVMLFSNVAHLLDALTTKVAKLKTVEYHSTNANLLDEFMEIRQRYPHIGFLPRGESAFLQNRMTYQR